MASTARPDASRAPACCSTSWGGCCRAGAEGGRPVVPVGRHLTGFNLGFVIPPPRQFRRGVLRRRAPGECYGETMTEAVRTAIQDRLKRVEAQRRGGRRLADRLDDIARHAASLPVRRRRTE